MPAPNPISLKEGQWVLIQDPPGDSLGRIHQIAGPYAIVHHIKNRKSKTSWMRLSSLQPLPKKKE
jgi:hypothetical protein